MRRIKLSATESTNSYLKRLISSESVSDFTVVTALEQNKGRGQVDAIWESEPGKNLTFSVLKRYNGLGSHKHFLISICVSCAVYNVLSDLGVPRLSVKWPNDILSGTSKICGILIENSIGGKEIKTSVIGIGLNVNQTLFLNQPKASSLKLVLDREFNLEVVLEGILGQLKSYLDQVESLDWNSMKERYEKILFKKSIPATFQEPNSPLFTGIITGITKDGKLQISLEDDTTMAYGLKEVKFHY